MGKPLEIQVTADINNLKQRMNEGGATIKSFSESAGKSLFTLTEKLRDLESSVFTEKSRSNIAAYNAQIQATKKEIDQLSNVGKQGFDKFGNAVNGSLGSVSKLYSGLRQLAYIIPGIGIAGVFNLLFEGAQKLIEELAKADTAIDEFKLHHENLNIVLAGAQNEYVKAVTNVNNVRIAFDQARQGIISKNEALKLYNDTIGKTTGEVKSLEEAEKALAKNADAYVKFTLYKAAANIALQESAKKAFEALTASKNLDAVIYEKKFSTGIFGKNAAEQREAEAIAIQNQKKDAEKASQDFLDIQKEFQAKAEALAKEFKFDFNGIKEPTGKVVKDIRTINDVLEEMNKQLYYLSQNELKIGTNEARAKISAIENAIGELIKKFGLDGNSKLILKLYSDIQFIQQGETLKKFISPGKILAEQFAAPVPVDIKIQPHVKFLLPDNWEKAIKDWMAQMEIIKSTAVDAISSIGDSIANAVSGKGNFFGNLFSGIFRALGAGLKQLGTYAIATSTAIMALKKSLGTSLGIAGGIALVALGGIIQAAASKIQAPAFATGVRNFKGGFADVGERGRERIFLPKGSSVQPNNELQAYGNNNGSSYIAETRISGQDLVIAIKRSTAAMNRNGSIAGYGI